MVAWLVPTPLGTGHLWLGSGCRCIWGWPWVGWFPGSSSNFRAAAGDGASLFVWMEAPWAFRVVMWCPYKWAHRGHGAWTLSHRLDPSGTHQLSIRATRWMPRWQLCVTLALNTQQEPAGKLSYRKRPFFVREVGERWTVSWIRGPGWTCIPL